MKLATVVVADGTNAARIEGDEAVLLPQPDVGAVLAEPDGLAVAAAASGTRIPVGSVRLCPPVLRPSKIICLGLNYRTHIAEMGRELPEFPTLFAKFTEALIGPLDPIVIPEASSAVDWEGEFGVVVGRTLRHGDPAEAAAAIAGFTVVNDVSMRDWQRRTLQWLQGKTWEASTPCGPYLVTPDEVGGTSPDLGLRVEVDGEVMQAARTGDLLFGPVECVAYISQIVTLRPGDLISTGTPGGVGDARDPKVFLQPGQVLRTVIEGVGELVNECVKDDRA